MKWPAAISLAVLTACGADEGTEGSGHQFSDAEVDLLLRHRFDGTVPPDPTNAVADDDDAKRLGQYLFYDTGLSSDGRQSCATCHRPDYGFADPESLSIALDITDRNTPSLVNVALNRWFYWDGRCDTLWCQAASPLEDPGEHGTNRLAIAHHIHNDTELADAYNALFGPLPDLGDAERFPSDARPVVDDETDPEHIAWESMTLEDQRAATTVFVNVAKAIAAYQRDLVQFNSPFDGMLDALEAGDSAGGTTVNSAAKRGAQLFVGEGMCWACHTGPGFTNKEFHNIALPAADGIDNGSGGRYDGISSLLTNPFNALGEYSDDRSDASLKLTHLIQSPEEIGSFKTPGLRNLLDTAPFMHGGHFATLTETVQHYNRMDDRPIIGHREELLLPLFWSDEQVADVVAFLESLQGEPLPIELTVQPPTPR